MEHAAVIATGYSFRVLKKIKGGSDILTVANHLAHSVGQVTQEG